jgi:hypothetical protein
MSLKLSTVALGKSPRMEELVLTGKYSCLIRGRLVISMATWPHDVRFQFSGRVKNHNLSCSNSVSLLFTYPIGGIRIFLG